MRSAAIGIACLVCAWGQSTPAAGPPARMVVTLGHLFTREAPILTKEDVNITQNYEPLAITNLIPLRGERAALELYILVDSCSNCEPGSKFDELRRFISSQASTTTVGVAYIQNGRLQVAEKPTLDRDRVIKALNAPEGSRPANPFVALAELIRAWTPSPARHAVVMISNGLDPAANDRMLDRFADTALEEAQRAGVTVYAIYHPSADYTSADYSKLYSGQLQLAHVGYETGGEAYFTGFGPLPSIAPFLADIADHLANQYELDFVARPGEAAGALEDVRVRSSNHDIDLMAPGRVVVPAPLHK